MQLILGFPQEIMDAKAENPSQAADKSPEQEYYLTNLAKQEFESANYERCLEILEELQAADNANNRNKHNRAIAAFYKLECKEHAELLQNLNELDDDVENKPNPVLRYNKAVIYFHRHMYGTAIQVLQPLLNSLKSMDSSIAIMIGVLMLRLFLASNQFNRAWAFVKHVQDELSLKIELPAPEKKTVEITTDLQALNRDLSLLALVIKVLKRTAMSIKEDGTVSLATLKAHQYYLMKDFQMAAKQLQRINSENFTDGKDLSTCIANNMGVIHLRVRHYALAAKFFQNALSFDKHIAAHLRNASLHNIGRVRSCEILYNLGIAMLHLRRPKEAFQCFLGPLKSYHNNARAWFRISEACIMNYEQNRLEEPKRIKVIPAIVVGAQNPTILRPSSNLFYPNASQSSAVPEPTLEFAALCLRNALNLIRFYETKFSEEEHPDDYDEEHERNRKWTTVRDNNFCNPSQPITKKSMKTLLLSTFAAYSYVSLRLGDYVMALEMAQELLKSEELSGAHKMLGHMYAGEALVMLDKVEEARTHVEPKLVSTLNEFDFETKDWEIKSLDAAQNVMRYNLAVISSYQRDFGTAREMLNQLTHPVVSTKIGPLKKYLDVKATNSFHAL